LTIWLVEYSYMNCIVGLRNVIAVFIISIFSIITGVIFVF